MIFFFSPQMEQLKDKQQGIMREKKVLLNNVLIKKKKKTRLAKGEVNFRKCGLFILHSFCCPRPVFVVVNDRLDIV